MNNKGFTLIEAIGVITLLVILSLIATTGITMIIKENKNKAHDIQLSNILSSAISYINTEKNTELPTEYNSFKKYFLKELNDNGYIDAQIIDPLNKNEIDLDKSYFTINLVDYDTDTIDDLANTKYDGLYKYTLIIEYK